LRPPVDNGEAMMTGAASSRTHVARKADHIPESIDTALTRLLGIRYPILQGGMQWVGRAELAAAVSNAGAFGTISCLTQRTPDLLATEIARCRTLTDKPFGVNLTILPTINPPPYERYFDVAIEARVAAIETAGAIPALYFSRANAAGIPVIHKCTTIRHALSAQKRGAAMISMDGFEAAGHPGEDDISGLVLIPLALRSLNAPILASGGIATGAAMAAALALGAAGVTMGTRFCATREAPIHGAIKQAYVNAAATDTTLIFRTFGNTARVMRNAVSKEVLAIEQRNPGLDFSVIAPLVAGSRGRQALETGDFDAGLVWASQVVGLIDDIPSCAELVNRIVAECVSRIEELSRTLCSGRR
jgi:nitronate monooxygenase